MATYALLQPPLPTDLGGALWQLVCRRPSIGETNETRDEWCLKCKDVNDAFDARRYPDDEVKTFGDDFIRRGQNRSTLYEPSLKRRISGDYGRGFNAFRSLRPDVIVKDSVKKNDEMVEFGEYRICEISQAEPRDDSDDAIDAAITKRILRTGHSVEFTAFLRDNLADLERYLIRKIEAYAAMLESV